VDLEQFLAEVSSFSNLMQVAQPKLCWLNDLNAESEDAEYEITGVASSQKAGAAKKIIMGSWHSREEASVQVTDLKTGEVAFAYAYTNENSARGKRSAAEACAKHLKNALKAQ
jgi:hypothetical protein